MTTMPTTLTLQDDLQPLMALLKTSAPNADILVALKLLWATWRAKPAAATSVAQEPSDEQKEFLASAHVVGNAAHLLDHLDCLTPAVMIRLLAVFEVLSSTDILDWAAVQHTDNTVLTMKKRFDMALPWMPKPVQEEKSGEIAQLTFFIKGVPGFSQRTSSHSDGVHVECRRGFPSPTSICGTKTPTDLLYLTVWVFGDKLCIGTAFHTEPSSLSNSAFDGSRTSLTAPVVADPGTSIGSSIGGKEFGGLFGLLGRAKFDELSKDDEALAKFIEQLRAEIYNLDKEGLNALTMS